MTMTETIAALREGRTTAETKTPVEKTEANPLDARPDAKKHQEDLCHHLRALTMRRMMMTKATLRTRRNDADTDAVNEEEDDRVSRKPLQFLILLVWTELPITINAYRKYGIQ